MKISPGFRFGLYLQVSGLLTEPRVRPTHLRSQGCTGPGLASLVLWGPSKCPASPVSHLVFQPHWASWQFLNTPCPQITAPLPHLLFSFPWNASSFLLWLTNSFSFTEAGLRVPPPKPNPISELTWGLWESHLILRARGSQLPRITWWGSFLQEIRLQEGLYFMHRHTRRASFWHSASTRVRGRGSPPMKCFSFPSHVFKSHSIPVSLLSPVFLLLDEVPCGFYLVPACPHLWQQAFFRLVQWSVLLLVRESLRPQNSASQGMSFHHRSLTNSELTGDHLSLISVGKLGRLRRNSGNWQMQSI